MQQTGEGRVVVQEWVSLDGYAAGPAGETDVMRGVDETADARSQEYNATLLDGVHAVLLGSRTYRQFVEYWPTSTEPIAAGVNAVPKVVASSSLSTAPWGEHTPADVVVDAHAYVREHRSTGSGILLVWGSLALARSLVAAGEVDELDLFVSPTWLGQGTPLLDAAPAPALEQLASEDWGTVTHLRYRLVG
jgi:dihydrofolate reductase